MNDTLIRKFCESRHRRLIVATATGLLGLVALLPMVDEYFDKRSSRNDLIEDLDAARVTAESLPLYEKQTGEVGQELGALEVRSVDETGVARFRSRLVDVVRDCGCQIRRIEVGAATRRPWKENDEPLSESSSPTALGETPFSLERRSVVLAVDGSMSAINELVARLEKEKTISHPHRLQLQATGGGGESVTLELDLWLFALSRTAA